MYKIRHLLMFTFLTLVVFNAAPIYAQEEDSLEGEAVEATPESKPKKNVKKNMTDKKSKNLDSSLEPRFASSEASPLFENVIAVQKKAKVKKGMWLFHPFLSADFSDAPYTMWGFNMNMGKAVSEYWEVYLNLVPYYLSMERSISKKVSELTLANGKKAKIDFEQAKFHVGVEVNFVPAYGKDSWGPFGIIRSDTFFNTGLGVVQYESSSGLRTKLGMGKTFYLTPDFNVRLMAGGSFIEMITGGVKEVVMVGLLEGGLVYYF